jgi:F-type H+-transporting ATPase subunit delta
VGSATRQASARARTALEAEQSIDITVGEQLLAAVRVIASSSQLRSALADTAADAGRKADLVSRVFGSLGAPASRLLNVAVTQRWSTQGQLLDGIEEIGIRALARSGGESANIDSELFEFARAVQSDAELQLAIDSKLGDPAGKVVIVDRLIGGRVSPESRAIASHLVQSLRGRRIRTAVAQASEIAADAAGGFVATVTSAAPLPAEQLTRLTAILSQRYGRTPHIDLVVDPSLVGGLRVQVQDDVIDLSVASRLSQLRLSLAG